MLINKNSHLLLGTSLFLGGAALGAPGSVDTTFATNGIFQQVGGAIKGVVVQPDGKILMSCSGELGPGLSSGFMLLRFNANGSLDTTLDTDGIQVTAARQAVYVEGMAVSPVDDKVVVTGSSYNTVYPPAGGYVSHVDFTTLRYNADGSVDTSFNTTGSAITAFPSGNSGASCATVQADGKVIAAGFVEIATNNRRFAVARYLANGTLDASFNTTGTVVTNPGSYCYIEGIVVSPTDQKIIVVGTYQHPTNYKYQSMIARYNPNGTLDTSFDTDGIVFTAAASGESNSAKTLALQSDGKIVVGGSNSNPGTMDDFALFRYNTDGSLDTTFSTDGMAVIDVAAGYDQINDIKIQADGRILAGGTAGGDASNYSSFASFALLMFNSDGSLDPTFGTGGASITTGTATRDMLAIAQQADGKIIGAGEFWGVNGNPGESAAIRYNLLADVVVPPIVPPIDPPIIPPTVPTRKADLLLGLTSAATFGADIYSATGIDQTQALTITSGSKKSVFIGIQNDGSAADSFKLLGTEGNANFTVAYFNGTQNVTDAVVAGTYDTGSLAAGDTQFLKATIKAKTPLAGKKRTFSLTTTSAAEATVSDKALIKASSKKK